MMNVRWKRNVKIKYVNSTVVMSMLVSIEVLWMMLKFYATNPGWNIQHLEFCNIDLVCLKFSHLSKLELRLHWKKTMQLMRKLASCEFSPCISIWQLPHISIRWSNSIVDGWEMNHITAIVMNGSNAFQIVDKLVGCQFLWDHWVQAVHNPSS